MTPLEELVRERLDAIAAQARSAGPLLQSLLGILFSGPNGLKGSLDKLNASGNRRLAGPVLDSKADAPPLFAAIRRPSRFRRRWRNYKYCEQGRDRPRRIVTAALAYATPHKLFPGLATLLR